MIAPVKESRRAFQARSRRRILCLFPPYTPSFATFEHAYPLLPGVRACMPPQGLLLIAAYLPSQWQVRFADLNMGPISDRQLRWADAVLISGMHVQRPHIHALAARARALGKLTVLGGPSVSACPQYYPDLDILHVGELGDATDAIIDRLDTTVERPPRQLIFETRDRLPMDQFPLPAYDMLNLRRYFLGSVQFSSGCPFLCEFCDIPTLYGRKPRMKTPQRVCEELDAMLAAGLRGGVYFVDDNFVADPAAARELLPHLVDWQRSRDFPLRFCCEATLNLAQMPDLLDLMRQAMFHTCFCGIESPENDALVAMRKKQNTRKPILDAVSTLNSYGIEVVSGIILGLDSDTDSTTDHIIEFIDASHIPLLTINLLYALPRTPLYDRLLRDGRVVDQPGLASNVRFKRPYDQVLQSWQRVVDHAYDPRKLLERFRWQAERTFSNRLPHRPKASAADVLLGLRILRRLLWRVGLRADYRREFWSVCWPLLRAGRIEDVIHIGLVARHLIEFSRDCHRGRLEASFYADPNRAGRPSRTAVDRTASVASPHQP